MSRDKRVTANVLEADVQGTYDMLRQLIQHLGAYEGDEFELHLEDELSPEAMIVRDGRELLDLLEYLHEEQGMRGELL